MPSLIALYGNINNIDAFIGGHRREPRARHEPGLHAAGVTGRSVHRLRDGDRFFFTGDAGSQRPFGELNH